MLFQSHNRAYQEFLILLEKLENDCSNLNLKISKTAINERFNPLQASFQEYILPLTDAELDTAIASRWQSVQTEIKREFRLLSTDILFLTSSRQASTRETRLQSVRKRITKLIGYCRVMLKDWEEQAGSSDENSIS